MSILLLVFSLGNKCSWGSNYDHILRIKEASDELVDDELIQVDHSIVEGFSQGGRSCITTRVYPTEAIYGAARLFLFNNATGVNVTASIKIWEMASADIHPYPLDQP